MVAYSDGVGMLKIRKGEVMSQPENDAFDKDRVRQILPPRALAELATLHGMDTEEARAAVQRWPLGSRVAMEGAGLIEMRDTGQPQFEVSLTPHFAEAVDAFATEA
jgi:hypothetical protein